MKVRTIVIEEIEKFVLIGSKEKNASNSPLMQEIEEGEIKLDHCFVTEDDNQFLGRIIYGVFEEEPYDFKIWGMKLVNLQNNVEELGSKLLSDSIKEMKKNKFKTIEYHLYSVADSFEEYKNIFLKSGFEKTQEKKSFLLDKIVLIDTSTRLSYKTLNEIGEDEFINAIERVTVDTLDKDDRSSINEYGSKQAAITYFNMLKDMDFNKEWWRVAYNSSNEFVGLVVPQMFRADLGCINYIGVSPDQRGKGYIDDLLLEGSRILHKNKITKIIADIDEGNFPIEKSLLKLGYQYKRSLIVLELS